MTSFSPDHAAASERDVAEFLASCYQSRTSVFPVGGNTSTSYLAAAQPVAGQTLGLQQLNRIVDYPARDMTITLEAGFTMAELARVLAGEGQQLPIDVPHAGRATLGGVVATSWNGPRRFGLGAIRDFVIGIRAVDGTGLAFQGGGRVVKNVAGYDFCKLLTGSCGTLAVITQVTLKVVPLATRATTLVVPLVSSGEARQWLDTVMASAIAPAAVEIVTGPAWQKRLSSFSASCHWFGLLRLEGTASEVNWMIAEHRRDCAGLTTAAEISSCDDEIGSGGHSVWRDVIEFSQEEANSPLELQAFVRPSEVMPFLELVRELDPGFECVAHAGHGVLLIRLSQVPDGGWGRLLVSRLQPAAIARGGRIVVLCDRMRSDMTRQGLSGGIDPARTLQQAVKAKFDPAGILNPGHIV